MTRVILSAPVNFIRRVLAGTSDLRLEPWSFDVLFLNIPTFGLY